MADLCDAMVRALEELDKGPAIRGSRTAMRTVQFNVATRLVARGFATYQPHGGLQLTHAGRAVLEQHRAGFR